MKLSLSQNICKLRKANHLTQEQLAEALGVTFAAISKWERGAATPELNLIAQMADLFGVSMDVLVGFAVHNNHITAVEERIHNLQRSKQYADAMAESESALLRYPNDFRIVYRAGEVYAFAGMEGKAEPHLRRCIALLEHAISLLSQNTDPEISEVSIQSQIAQSYLLLGEVETGLEILKQYNVNGIYDGLIALTYAAESHGLSPKLAEPYLIHAFAGVITESTRVMMAYANYYQKMGTPAASRDALLWLVQLLQSIKIDPNATGFVDKATACYYAQCAILSYKMGETETAQSYLHHAFQMAKAFDHAPTYRMENTKFCVGDTEHATVYDDLGESAMAAVEQQLTEEDGNDALLALWKHLIRQEPAGGMK